MIAVGRTHKARGTHDLNRLSDYRKKNPMADPAAPPQPTGAAPAARRFFKFHLVETDLDCSVGSETKSFF